MRLHFQEKAWDLIAAVGYTVVMAAVMIVLNVGNLLATLLVVFIPGYVLVAALFPGSPGMDEWALDWIERIALSFGISIAVVPLLGILLNFAPWGLRFAPVVVTIALFTAGVGGAAYWRRARLPVERRLSLNVNLELPAWREYSTVDKAASFALAASVVVAGGAFAYALLTPRSGEVFTEFYVLGPEGKASGYPTALNVSETARVILGIANHESTIVDYTLRIDLLGIGVIYNATSDSNETVEVNRTHWSTYNVSLRYGAVWAYNYTFSIPFSGLWKVQFLLFRAGNFDSVYRELHLFIRVT